MIPQSRRGRQRADFLLHAGLHRPGFACLWHHGDDFFRAQDLPDRHGDGSPGNVGQLREPSLVYLLLPASFVELHYKVCFLAREIRWRIVKREVAVFSDSHKADVNGPGNQFTANSLCDLLGVALSIQKVVLSDSGLVTDSSFENDPFQNVFPETRRMRSRQANVFVQVKKLHPAPIDVCRASERVQKFKLRCPGSGNDSRGAILAQSSSQGFRGVLRRCSAQRLLVIKNLDLQVWRPFPVGASCPPAIQRAFPNCTPRKLLPPAQRFAAPRCRSSAACRSSRSLAQNPPAPLGAPAHR